MSLTETILAGAVGRGRFWAGDNARIQAGAVGTGESGCAAACLSEPVGTVRRMNAPLSGIRAAKPNFPARSEDEDGQLFLCTPGMKATSALRGRITGWQELGSKDT